MSQITGLPHSTRCIASGPCLCVCLCPNPTISLGTSCTPPCLNQCLVQRAAQGISTRECWKLNRGRAHSLGMKWVGGRLFQEWSWARAASEDRHVLSLRKASVFQVFAGREGVSSRKAMGSETVMGWGGEADIQISVQPWKSGLEVQGWDLMNFKAYFSKIWWLWRQGWLAGLPSLNRKSVCAEFFFIGSGSRKGIHPEWVPYSHFYLLNC